MNQTTITTTFWRRQYAFGLHENTENIQSSRELNTDGRLAHPNRNKLSSDQLVVVRLMRCVWCFYFLFCCIPRIPQFTRLEPYCSAAWALTTHNGSQRSGAQRYLRAVYLRSIATTRVLFCCSTNTQTKYTPHCIHTVCICKSREQDLPASL